MMKTKLPNPVETYIRAINSRDADAFQSRFTASVRSKNGPITKTVLEKTVHGA